MPHMKKQCMLNKLHCKMAVQAAAALVHEQQPRPLITHCPSTHRICHILQVRQQVLLLRYVPLPPLRVGQLQALTVLFSARCLGGCCCC
jgi:hypothetical protein